MQKLKNFFWPVVAAVAVIFSIHLLRKELAGLSASDIWHSLQAIPHHNYLGAVISTVCAYAALAWYDRIALLHLNREKGISWLFVTLCSFTTYALSHNIGASVFSGAMVRFRAYTSKGLTAPEIAILVTLCSFTFALGTMVLAGSVMLLRPDAFQRIFPVSTSLIYLVGGGILTLVALYVLGSWRNFKPFKFGKTEIFYPRMPVVRRQLIAAPLELLGAAGIIYFALPDAGNPGYLVVLGVFLASFSAALLSHAPGGVGVLEAVFLLAMPNMDKAGVIAALIVFRLFYLIVPLFLSLFVIFAFERDQIKKKAIEAAAGSDGSAA